MAGGQFQVKYASFSDAEVFYEADLVSGSSDVTSRVMFEACNLPQDNVTFEADDSGLLKPFKNPSEYDVINGQLVSWSWQPVTSSVLTGSVLTNYVEGSTFASVSDGLLTSSIDNFKNLMILSTHDSIFDDAKFFTLSTNEITWVITDNSPIDVQNSATTVDVDVLDSLFDDPRCAHLPNFKRLPPINFKRKQGVEQLMQVQNKHNAYVSQVRLGMKSGLKDYKKIGYGRTIDVIDPHPRKNNFVCQMFEQHDNKLIKLDVIDYGITTTSDTHHPTEHTFFMGKIFTDGYGAHTFVHMFTLVFD
jgi:hypothetical protein